MEKILVSNDKQEIYIGVKCCRILGGFIALPIYVGWHFRYDSREDHDSRDYDLWVKILCFKFLITIHKWSTGHGKPWERTLEEE